MKDTYLGDGVYASHMGDIITLDLRAQEPTMPYTIIVLEPQILESLNKYYDDIMKEMTNGKG